MMPLVGGYRQFEGGHHRQNTDNIFNVNLIADNYLNTKVLRVISHPKHGKNSILKRARALEVALVSSFSMATPANAKDPDLPLL